MRCLQVLQYIDIPRESQGLSLITGPTLLLPMGRWSLAPGWSLALSPLHLDKHCRQGSLDRRDAPDKKERSLGEACFDELQLPLLENDGLLHLFGC